MKQPVRRRFRLRDLVITGIASAIAFPLSAQGPPAGPVRYTEAREHDVQLPGVTGEITALSDHVNSVRRRLTVPAFPDDWVLLVTVLDRLSRRLPA